jgi:hypothetical protein
MRRIVLHLVAAASTLSLLVGASFGVSIAVASIEIGDPTQVKPSWESVWELGLWVLLLMTPVAEVLQRKRDAFWRIVLLASSLVAGIEFARLWSASSDQLSSASWALLDGVVFALGLLFYDFIYRVRDELHAAR